MLENEIESYQNENALIVCPICENGHLFENNQLELIKCSNCSLELSNRVKFISKNIILVCIFIKKFFFLLRI